MNKINVGELDTVPEKDLYRGHGVTDTQFVIDPSARRCWVEQWREDYANATRWNGLLITASISPEGNDSETPDCDKLSEYLNSAEAQELMVRVCDGWEQDGERGTQDEDSDEAMNELCEAIMALPSIEWSVWDIDEYLDQHGVCATDTDERIAELTAEYEGDAEAEHVVLDESISDFLTKKRDELRAEWIERATDLFEGGAVVTHRVASADALEVTLTWPDGDVAVVNVTYDAVTKIIDPDAELQEG